MMNSCISKINAKNSLILTSFLVIFSLPANQLHAQDLSDQNPAPQNMPRSETTDPESSPISIIEIDPNLIEESPNTELFTPFINIQEDEEDLPEPAIVEETKKNKEDAKEEEIEEFKVQLIPQLNAPLENRSDQLLLVDPPNKLRPLPKKELVDFIPDPQIKVLEIVLAEDSIENGKTQWIEVYLQNKSKIARAVSLKLELTMPNGRVKNIGYKAILLEPTAIKNVIFRYRTEINAGGVYLVNVYVNSRDGKLLALNTRRAEFNVLGSPLRSINTADVPTPESSDKNQLSSNLKFTEIKFENSQAISTDVVPALVSIQNTGTSNVEKISVKTYLTRAENEYAPIGGPLYQMKDIILAPGERKEIRFNVLLPQNLDGQNYKILGLLEENFVPFNSSLGENIALSQNELSVHQIALSYPEDGANMSFEENINFSWRSATLKRFFIEISADEDFFNQELMLRLPEIGFVEDYQLNSLLTENRISKLLKGERKTEPIYWRVVGVDQLGLFIYSEKKTIYF